MKYLISIILLFFFVSGCSDEELFGENVRHDLWLIHKNAKLPVVVEGNSRSNVFVILLHGGPGSSSQIFNSETKAFSDPLEDDYAMVYYDQRNAGLALGEWNEEKLTIEQHIEDLEKVIELLQHKFGDEIQIFLAGHSWGGYLGISFLLNIENQQKVKAWINIDGLINRNRNMKDVMTRIDSIGTEQITNNVNIDDWKEILKEVESERMKAITQYSVDTEGEIFNLIRLAESQIVKDNLLNYNFNSPFSSIHSDNYDPFRILITNTGSRDKGLREQMYSFDSLIEASLENIRIPTLSIYGYYDVKTPLQQGEYLNSRISTETIDKKVVILNNSGHSSMGNEPVLLANEIKTWIENYR